MDKRVTDIFDSVQAEEELKRKTVRCLCEEIKKRNGRGMIRQWRWAAVCTALAVCFLCGGYCGKIYYTPCAYIDMDVNPSVELTVNGFGRVIGSDAYNDDGAELLKRVSLRHRDYNEAVERLLVEMDAGGYFSRDTLLSVSVQTDSDEGDSMLENLQQTIDKCRETHHYNTITDVFCVTEEVRHCAHEKNVSPAKYLAIQELLAVDSGADFESCMQHSVHELQQMARQYCDGYEEDDTHDHGHGQRGGHHH